MAEAIDIKIHDENRFAQILVRASQSVHAPQAQRAKALQHEIAIEKLKQIVIHMHEHLSDLNALATYWPENNYKDDDLLVCSYDDFLEAFKTEEDVIRLYDVYFSLQALKWTTNPAWGKALILLVDQLYDILATAATHYTKVDSSKCLSRAFLAPAGLIIR